LSDLDIVQIWTNHNPLTPLTIGSSNKLRIGGTRVRISSGAPIAYKTSNISVRGLFVSNDGLQDVLTTNDPDGLVVDFYRVDYRADVALARIGVAVVELIGHQARKGIDLLGIHGRDGTALRARGMLHL